MQRPHRLTRLALAIGLAGLLSGCVLVPARPPYYQPYYHYGYYYY